MADIRIDTSRLTYKTFLIAGQTPAPLDGTTAPPISLAPGTYSFTQGGPGFQFEVTQSGLVEYDAANDQFLEGRGTNMLVVTGFEATFDLTALSHDLQPNLVAAPDTLTRDTPHVLHLVPGSYTFILARGLADFGITVTRDGRVELIDPALAGCARITARTVTITGYTLTFDLTALSHDLSPEMLGNPQALLSRSTPTPLTLLPGTYLYVLARGLADFGITVTRDGRVELIDPALAGCARITARTVTITGYTLTFDLTALSHDLSPEMLGNPQALLSRSTPTPLTLLPGTYLYVLARGLADFGITVTRDGRVELIDPALAGCARITARTVTITGYTLTFDLTALSHDLSPEMLGNPQALLSRSTPTPLTLLPGTYLYVLARGLADFGITVTRDGRVELIDPALAGCARITARTVTITGYTLTFDLTALSHDLSPEMLGNPQALLSRSTPTPLTLLPGTYLYVLARGLADFGITVTRDGRVELIDPALAGCARITARTVTITGYTLTFDLTALSHDLSPEMLGNPQALLSRSTPTPLTLLPGTYLYVLARGLADFGITVTRDGRVELIDPALAGCARITARTVTITGYTLTFDLTALSHDLSPEMLGNPQALLSRSTPTPLTLLPGTYLYVLARGLADFGITVTRDGRVELIDPALAGCARITARTVTITGYTLTFDLTALSHDLSPEMLGNPQALLSRSTPTPLTLLPGTYLYVLARGLADFGITVTRDGRVELIDPALAGCARITARTVTITGYTLTFDLTALSHDLSPEMLGNPQALLSRSTPTPLTLLPGTYLYVLARGLADFGITVTRDGRVELIDPALAGCARITARTVTITGYTLTFDLTALSHDLSPEMLGNPQALLSRSTPTPLTLLPGTYLYVLARGLADFGITVTRDGRVELIDPALAGCARITARTVTITGYTLTFDLTALSHDLSPEMLGNPQALLSRSTPTPLTLLPGTYVLNAVGAALQLTFTLGRDGTITLTDGGGLIISLTRPLTPQPDTGLPSLLSACRDARMAREAAWRRLHDSQAQKSDLERRLQNMGQDFAASEFGRPFRDALEEVRGGLIGTEQAAADSEARVAAADSAYDTAAAAEPRLFGAGSDLPLLLLPVGLETVYRATGPAAELWIRVYPDNVHIDTHETPLTDREHGAAQAYWQAVRAPRATDEEQAAAWRDVLALLGPSRALWAVEQLRDGDTAASKDDVWTRAARAQLLPHHFVFSGYRNGRLMWRVDGEPIPDVLPAGFAPPSIEQTGPDIRTDDDVPWQPSSRWLVDFDAAAAVGMAVRVPLVDPNLHYDFVTAVGVATTDPALAARRVEDLLIAHSYTSGISVLPAGTPTNNTPGSRSGWHSRPTPTTPEDLLRARSDFAAAAADVAAKRTATALGIDGARALATLPGGLIDDETLTASVYSLVGRLVTISRDWLPAPAEINDLPADVQFAADHFTAHVRSRGPLALLRIGRQPYGILPVTSLDLWRGSDVDARIVATVASVLAYLRANVHRAQRVGAGPDQDAVILDLLSRRPSSTRIRFAADIETFTNPNAWYVHPPATIGILEPRNPFALRGPGGPTPAGFDFTPALQPTPELLDFVTQRPLASHADIIRQLEAITPTWGPAPESIVIPDTLRTQRNELAKNRTLLTASSGGLFYQLALPVFDTSWALTWIAGVGNAIPSAAFPPGQFQRLLPALATLRSEAVALEKQAATRLPDIERTLCECLDTTSHRVDAWATSLATARLQRLRATTPTGLHTGAYGWVHDLEPTSPGQRTQRDGYIIAPSMHHAATAAVLRSGWLAHSDREAFAVNLTSARVRNAQRLLDGIRSGQTLDALLGYRFERSVHDRSLDQFIPAFRARYPLAPVVDTTAAGTTEAQSAISARNVVDGLALSKDQAAFDAVDPPIAVGADNIATIRQLIADLTDTIDAVGDLLLAESVHHIVGGNPLRAGLAAETASRGELPDEFAVVTTPRSASTITYTFAALTSNGLAPNSDWSNERALAKLEPAVEQWCRSRLGSASSWRFNCRTTDGSPAPVTLNRLGISALEAVRTATAGTDSPFAKRLVRAAGPDALALTDDPTGIGRYQEFVTLAEALRSTIATGAPLLASHLDPVVDGWEPADVDELGARIGRWLAVVHTSADALTAALGRQPPVSGDLARILGTLAGAGLPITIDSNDPHSLIAASHTALDSITTAELPDQPAPAPPSNGRTSALVVAWLAKITRPVQALIGDALPLLPVLRMTTTGIAELFAPEHRPGGSGLDQVTDWVRELARLRASVARADDALCGSEVLAGAAAPSFTVVQAPAAANQPWIATATGAARSSCVLATDGPIDLDNLTGLVFDSWSEVLPQPGSTPGTAEEIAAIAFHTARPDARPPQSLLLAVPPNPDRGWRAEDVHAVVAEAFELAQVRGLDLSDLPELRGALPPTIEGQGASFDNNTPFF